MTEPHSLLRLRRKHGSGAPRDSTATDGKRLVDAQSVRNAVVAGLIIVLIFSIFWISLSKLTDRVYPWLTVFLGFMLGHGIRLAGRGVDVRFPLLAAVLTLFGSLIANIVVAASVTAEANDVGTLQVLKSVTTMTWPVFFRRGVDSRGRFLRGLCGQPGRFLRQPAAVALAIPCIAALARGTTA